MLGLVTLAGILITGSAPAQNANMRALPLRLTIPVGVADPTPVAVGTTKTNAIQLAIVTSGLTENGTNITLALAGVPPGLTANLTTNSISDNGTHTAFLNVSSDGTVSQGSHDMAIIISGAATYRLPLPVIASHFWSGDSFTNAVSTNIATAGNWLNGLIPGVTDDVVLKDRGGVNGLPGPTNIIVSSDFEVASLRISPELDADANRYHNFEILPGASLKVTGPGGFTMLRDLKGLNRRLEASFSGGGTLLVANPAANFTMLGDYQANNTLDLQRLNNLVVDVNRMALGDYRAYPNFFTNGYAGAGTTAGIHQSEPGRFVPLVDLAATNFLRASFVDPNNYNDLGWRDYSFTIGNYSQQGSTTGLRFRLGYSNVFHMDSMCFGQALQGNAGTYTFRNTGSYARFRGAGGGNTRMSVLAIADSGSPAPPRAANARSHLNLGNGQVDMLLDRLFLAVDRTNNLSQMTVEGTLTIADGIFDVNTAFIGYQPSGNNLGDAAATGIAGPVGTLNINSNANSAGATFRVNTVLELGHTTASAAGGTTSAERTSGRITVTGGTLMANTITVGGVTKLSTNNFITVNNGRLIVTNAIGSADGRLNSLTLSGAAEATLLGVTVGQTNIFVNTVSIIAAGGVKFVRIPTLAGVVSYPATVPLISYTSESSPVLTGLSIVPPSGLFVKSVIDNTVNKTIDVTFTDEPPIVVVWRGTVNNQWDISTPNWVTQVGNIQTNFSEGFSVVFDNTVGGGPTTIEIPSPVTPGQVAATYGVLVANQSYTFNSGSILGGATIRKQGTGNLTINANVSTAVNVAQGALAGSSDALVGPTALESGTTMTAFAGTINGGLTVSNATVVVTGPVNGGLNLQAGTLVNASTINGAVALGTGSTLENQVAAVLNVTLPWTVTTNSTLINNGDIFHFGTSGGNLGLNVDGLLKGRGRIVQNGIQASSDVRVTLRAGGQLMIGNSPNEITNMTIAVRLDLLDGSTTTIDVDNTTPINDQITLAAGANGFGKVNFGAGNNQGGTVLINRIGGPAFNANTILYPFDQVFNQPDNTQPAIPKFIPPPAPGLVWSTYEVITNLTLQVTTIPAMTNSIVTDTNGIRSLVFEWPESYRGWRLEQQTNSLEVGLDWEGTNWTTVALTLGGTNVLYYPDTNDLSQFHIRSVQAVTDTNTAALNPTTFFRLTYP
jgi:hypothetical protein